MMFILEIFRYHLITEMTANVFKGVIILFIKDLSELQCQQCLNMKNYSFLIQLN